MRPFLPSSLAIPFKTCSIVALGATERISPGGYLNNPAELIKTIEPWDSLKYGNPVLIRLKKPLISSLITLHKLSSQLK